jgi:hypothetical protein
MSVYKIIKVESPLLVPKYAQAVNEAFKGESSLKIERFGDNENPTLYQHIAKLGEIGIQHLKEVREVPEGGDTVLDWLNFKFIKGSGKEGTTLTVPFKEGGTPAEHRQNSFLSLCSFLALPIYGELSVKFCSDANDFGLREDKGESQPKQVDISEELDLSKPLTPGQALVSYFAVRHELHIPPRDMAAIMVFSKQEAHTPSVY